MKNICTILLMNSVVNRRTTSWSEKVSYQGITAATSYQSIATFFIYFCLYQHIYVDFFDPTSHVYQVNQSAEACEPGA